MALNKNMVGCGCCCRGYCLDIGDNPEAATWTLEVSGIADPCGTYYNGVWTLTFGLAGFTPCGPLYLWTIGAALPQRIGLQVAPIGHGVSPQGGCTDVAQFGTTADCVIQFANITDGASITLVKDLSGTWRVCSVNACDVTGLSFNLTRNDP